MNWSRYDVISQSGGFSIMCFDDEGADVFSVWSSDLERLVELGKAHEKEFHSDI